MTISILIGDCRDVLRTLPDESVHCVVTSPPYWGLRDYGTAKWKGGDAACDHSAIRRNHNGEKQETSAGTSRDKIIGNDCGKCGAIRIDSQIGLEPDFRAYVATMVGVFREVRRVLRSDGICWINLGDSYSGSAGNLKPKDLCGIPWRVAFALQQPYYTGKIKDERDRIWLAAIIDGEGCFFIHKRKAGASAHSKYMRADGTEASYSRTADTYGVGLEISNTSKVLIDRISAIVPGGTFTSQSPEQNDRRKQMIYRWRLAPNETKRLAQELYPHLVAKQHQARLIFSCPSNGDAGAAAHQAMMDLHNGSSTSVDAPIPSSLFEPGWYLRQDIIWGKPNPMPESVTDRCTKAHEYLFLLSKSERYYYDAEAIKEAAADSVIARANYKVGGINRDASRNDGDIGSRQSFSDFANGRNKRSVWEVATQPFSEAHFATFPPALIEPCIKAGTSEKGCCGKCGAPWVRETDRQLTTMRPTPYDAGRPDGMTLRGTQFIGGSVATTGWSPSCKCDADVVPATVLDCFAGAGTTGLVADRLQRSAILIELNPDYSAMSERRIVGDAPLFVDVRTDNYNATDDFAKSYSECLAEIRARVAKGGPGWEPKL